jgi:hypothetical protein
MNEAEITQYITETFASVHVADAWGYTFFYYNPSDSLPDEFYFASLMSKDDDYDSFSNLNRPGVFRLNIGIGKATYRSHFGAPPSRLGGSESGDESDKGDNDSRDTVTPPDFTLLDQLLPHPIYGRQYWVSILSPSEASFEQLKPLLKEAYDLAVGKYNKQAARH